MAVTQAERIRQKVKTGVENNRVILKEKAARIKEVVERFGLKVQNTLESEGGLMMSISTGIGEDVIVIRACADRDVMSLTMPHSDQREAVAMWTLENTLAKKYEEYFRTHLTEGHTLSLQEPEDDNDGNDAS